MTLLYQISFPVQILFSVLKKIEEEQMGKDGLLRLSVDHVRPSG